MTKREIPEGMRPAPAGYGPDMLMTDTGDDNLVAQFGRMFGDLVLNALRVGMDPPFEFPSMAAAHLFFICNVSNLSQTLARATDISEEDFTDWLETTVKTMRVNARENFVMGRSIRDGKPSTPTNSN